MSLLAGILGTEYQGISQVDNSEFARAEGDQATAAMHHTAAALDAGSEALGRLMDAAANIVAVNPQSTDAIKMARIHLAEAMTACELPEDDAIDATAGLESEGVDAGLEAWQSVKDFVQKIIDWIKEQWAKLKGFVMKHWNKFFGDVERLEKRWEKIKKEAEEKQSGFTQEKNGKHDFESQAAWFYREGKLLKGTDLEAGVKEYDVIAKGTLDLADTAKTFAESIDVSKLGEEGDGAESAYDINDIEKAKLDFGNTVITGNLVPTLAKGESKGTHLIGNIVVATVTPTLNDATAAGLLTMLKGITTYVGHAAKDYKKPTKANMSYIEAGEVESLAEAHIELLGNLKSTKRNDDVNKASKAIDSVVSDLEKAKKDLPEEKEKVAAYKEGIKVIMEVTNLIRRTCVEFPVNFCKEAQVMSAAHADYATRCLGSYKKD